MDTHGAIGWRPITVQDVPEWARLLTTIEESAGTQEFAGEDDLLDDLRDPNVDPERGTIAAFRQESMIAWSGLRANPGTGGRHEMHLLGGVHPGHRGQGLGTRLLAWADQAAPVLHADRHTGGQLALAGHYLAGQDDAAALFAEDGYRQARWFHVMRRDLAATPPEILLPEGVRISGYAADLSAAAREVRNQAFRDHWGSTEWTAQTWQHWASSAAFRPAFSFLAYLHGQPAGVLIAFEYDAFRQATGHRECYIAVLGVTRAARRRGIASALIGRSLAAARADGCDIATLEVDAESPTGALGLYEHMEFAALSTSVTAIKELTG